MARQPLYKQYHLYAGQPISTLGRIFQRGPYQADLGQTAPLLGWPEWSFPQPADVFGVPQDAPVWRPGWGEFLRELWRRIVNPPAPITVPDNYLEDPSQWPPGRIPLGPRI